MSHASAVKAGRPAIDERALGAFSLRACGAMVPQDWRATAEASGVNWLESLSREGADRISERIAADRHAADRVVVSIHWGGNWGYEVCREEREFAHRLIDAGAVDVVHGHSSHHPRGIEAYRHKLILYGCGDFLNDYEGIAGYESFRPELTLMYFLELDAGSGDLERLTLVPMSVHRLRIQHAPAEASRWLARTMDRECRRLGARVTRQGNGTLSLSPGPVQPVR